MLQTHAAGPIDPDLQCAVRHRGSKAKAICAGLDIFRTKVYGSTTYSCNPYYGGTIREIAGADNC